MATKEAIRQFFATSPKERTKIKIGGKFSFSKLPTEVQKKIKERIAEKDIVAAKGFSGELPGIKINGKQVTKDNIHEFEIKAKIGIPKKIKEDKEEIKKEPIVKKIIKLVKKDSKLESTPIKKMTKKELEKYALDKFGVDIDRRLTKDKLIKQIEKLEEGQ